MRLALGPSPTYSPGEILAEDATVGHSEGGGAAVFANFFDSYRGRKDEMLEN